MTAEDAIRSWAMVERYGLYCGSCSPDSFSLVGGKQGELAWGAIELMLNRAVRTRGVTDFALRDRYRMAFLKFAFQKALSRSELSDLDLLWPKIDRAISVQEQAAKFVDPDRWIWKGFSENKETIRV